jgi:glycine/D-amino acid oxidase-like deaminating enzyme
VIGAGIAGIATAYYLCAGKTPRSLAILDPRAPMSYTSAQSGDNYRNWWPHPVMTAFTNDSIDELDRLARQTGNIFNMTSGGYVLATRRTDVADLLGALHDGIDVDVLAGAQVRNRFAHLSTDIRHALHIRRAGSIDGQQLGAWMLQRVRAAGGRRIQAELTAIETGRGFRLHAAGSGTIRADIVVNAAGPFAGRVAGLLGEGLPVSNVFQQKIAFHDTRRAIPRDMPFSIDLDEKKLAWSEEERAMLADDPDTRWLTRTMPGGTHCRPDGGASGTWVKLGWAYNAEAGEPRQDLANEPLSDPQFPEIVIRGAAQLIPALLPYVHEPPTRYSHYGGYYTMTEENWPLIGPLETDGAFTVAALSGFGSMAACAAGKLCAAWVDGKSLPGYGKALSLARYDDEAMMRELRNAASKGIL